MKKENNSPVRSPKTIILAGIVLILFAFNMITQVAGLYKIPL